MEAKDNFEHCGPLNNNMKLFKKNIFDFEPRFTEECFVKDTADRLSEDKSIKFFYKEDKHIRIPSEVFNSNCSSEISAELLRRLSLLNQFDPLLSLPQTSKVVNDSVNKCDNIQDRTKISSEICDTVFLKERLNGSISKTYKCDNIQDRTKISSEIYDTVFFKERLNGSISKNYKCDNIQDRTKISSEIYDTVFLKEMLNGSISKNYMANTSSLESPRKIGKPIFRKVLHFENTRPRKLYSQEEFQKALKVQELNLQRKFSQELLEYEKTCAAKNQELYIESSKLTTLIRTYRMILSEISAAHEILKTKNEENKAKFEDLCVSNEELKIDILATKEDCCKMEIAFSDIYKRYETAKSMIKNFKENENHLTKIIESMQTEIREKEIKIDFSKSRTQELNDEAAKELDSPKKYADTQIMILKTQLKKCEIKTCSLESDLKQAKSDRDNILSINEDLKKMFST